MVVKNGDYALEASYLDLLVVLLLAAFLLSGSLFQEQRSDPAGIGHTGNIKGNSIISKPPVELAKFVFPPGYRLRYWSAGSSWHAGKKYKGMIPIRHAGNVVAPPASACG